ncbi:glutamate racemase [Candidatus Falkowbacteria bacterium HGW-Falkowbacteria-2]|uniref:Glutamate racemase n=1 Tax=Candidatus Falkowbacteria bacterium HGW-Falkowbacteria-2 TaxID=2013769 RepID=A0A2N2DXM8_9BACT|nr:MAG: glutamate racemase [Candidatus Falkowbacteria bacterium HGW-Falkowbacteria-2]
MLKNKETIKIGVFDSGLGGLTVLKHLLKELPAYDYLYLGDTARVPYGSRSAEVIYRYTEEAVDFLFSKGCQLIILACNTASSQALRRLQQEYLPKKYPDRRILGVIIPLAQAAAHHDNIGVIGTKGTISSGVYKEEILKINKGAAVHSNSAPLLVPLIEEGLAGKPATNMILKKYLQPLKVKKIKTLILGCTHYPFVINDVRRIMGKNCGVPNPGQIIASSLTDYLERHPEYKTESIKDGKREFYLTDEPKSFKSIAENYLGSKIAHIELIEL